MTRKVTHMSLEGGVLFFEDGTEVSGVSVEMIKAVPEMLKSLQEAWSVICYAAQEAEGRVKKEKVGGWIHHAAKINAVITKTTGEST